MSFTQSFLAETAEIVGALDTDQVERDRHRPRAGSATRGGRPVHPRRRRVGGPRRPRRQRLPQALRLRGLRADRQRLRADRPHQRRGLGHHVLRVARGLAARRRRRAAGLLGRRRRRREATSPPTSSGRSSWPRSAAPRSSASSAATAAPRPSSPTPAWSIPPLYADRITPHTEGLCAVRLAPARHPPGAASDGDQVGVGSTADAGRTARAASSSSAAPASSAATSSTACSPATASSASRVYDNFSSGREWHLAPMRDDPRLKVVRGDVEDLRPLAAAMAATTRSSTSPPTPTSRRR